LQNNFACPFQLLAVVAAAAAAFQLTLLLLLLLLLPPLLAVVSWSMGRTRPLSCQQTCCSTSAAALLAVFRW
jgi:hypothetical protein